LVLAAKLYEDSAKLGYRKAQYILGVCYAEGRGVLADRSQALYWLERAHEQGYHPAFAKIRELTHK
jgi:TPR repeat protein